MDLGLGYTEPASDPRLPVRMRYVLSPRVAYLRTAICFVRRRSIGTCLACIAAAVTIVSAQSGTTPQPPREQRPVIRSEANFVRIDVYPTADGAPVTDLAAQDFEVLEDGVRQNVQSFEHVVIQPAGPQSQRAEPNTIEASRQLAANPRSRVFVLFLDVPHVTMDGTWTVREPLIRLVDRVLGDDDLVGVMTPTMSAADMVLARKTEVLADGLRARWPWGERHTLEKSALEKDYEACYPWEATKPVVREMIDRRREHATLNALRELIQYLGGIREERKAILTVTEGWLLYRENRDLTRPRVIDADGSTEPIPGPPPIGVGPDGRLRTENSRYGTSTNRSDCDRDRVALSMIDNEDLFRDLLGDANRANASFYTIDPRGLPVFDSPIGPEKPPRLLVDQANLGNRHDSMHELAANTDGIAVLNSNDLDRGLKRIADDLTSYYLLGYYSTNTKFDGKFRTLTVRVKRPGVDVRARRGYRAATEEEVTAARAAAGPTAPETVKPINAALADLARARPDTPFRINVVPRPGASGVTTLWVAGEVRGAATSNRTAEGQVDIQVSGGATGNSQIALPVGQRAFMTLIALDKPVASGSVDIRARVSGLGVIPLTDNVRIDAGSAPRALLFRRGPSTGNRMQPAGDPQFSRTERVRLEIPIAAGVTLGDGRVLDRSGNLLAVPVTIAERTEEGTGQRWLTADLTLAPLTLGDYAVDLGFSPAANKEERVLTAIRVTR